MSIKDDQILTGTEDMTAERNRVSSRVSSDDAEQSIASSPRETRPGGATKDERHTKREANFMERTAQFIRDTRAEMRRVDWPSATQVKNTTIITIIAVIFFALYLYAVDQSFTFLIAQLSRLLSWLLSFVV